MHQAGIRKQVQFFREKTRFVKPTTPFHQEKFFSPAKKAFGAVTLKSMIMALTVAVRNKTGPGNQVVLAFRSQNYIRNGRMPAPPGKKLSSVSIRNPV